MQMDSKGTQTDFEQAQGILKKAQNNYRKTQNNKHTVTTKRCKMIEMHNAYRDAKKPQSLQNDYRTTKLLQRDITRLQRNAK